MGLDSLNKWVLRRDLNVGRNVDVRMSRGSSYQSRGAELLKGLSLSPIVDRLAGGVERTQAEVKISIWDVMYIQRSSVRYGGARLWI